MKESRSRIKEQLLNKGIIIIILLLVLCSCSRRKTLSPLSSRSVNSSINNGVFLKEYKPVCINILDTINFAIKEVFAENCFGYKNFDTSDFTIYHDVFQIKIITYERITDLGYSKLWKIDGFSESSRFNLVRRFRHDSIPPDTLLIKVVKGYRYDDLVGKDNKKEFGSILLVRQK